jgi:hypothetical protein
MLKCRKWRRERDAMLRRLDSDKLTISSRRDRTDLEVLFREGATTAVLRFIEKAEVGKKLTSETNKYDLWDVDRLGRCDDEEATEYGGG